MEFIGSVRTDVFTVKCVYCEKSWKLQSVGQGASEQQLVAWIYSGNLDSSGSRRSLEHRGHIHGVGALFLQKELLFYGLLGHRKPHAHHTGFCFHVNRAAERLWPAQGREF